MSSSNFSDIINTLKPDFAIIRSFPAVVSCTCFIARYPCCSFFICRSNYVYFLSSEFTYGHAAFPYRAIYLTDYERINQNFRSIIKDGGEDFAFGNCKQSCDIVLMNSCRAIEGKCIDYLSSLCQKKVVTVGPLATQPDSEEEYSEIMQWLSQKNQFSTVFISFGSENYLSKEQIEEMARGLELCDVNFIWVVRFPVGNTTRIEETLPEGFLDRVKERVDSIYFGVPVIAMPLKLDQPLNASLMVEHGAAIVVVRNDGGRFDGDKVAKAIKMLVLEKTGEGMRSKAIELSEQ
ncbi:beta-D-glucosyl crocetin beta-1,6-glucosyltransferase-like [Olea europaea subsp. europaea]|uniref:Beta-D-glucosyl crocetin beta-1,6-glucosyltransferase-like n=1 Tax=Olea europaea subsp. europaea TaxID=158383 RepID=A0A8S0VJ99_OLEEU|nr:beta-D-glucosyl crocetin beta-1,6-glucosyltransferase-like [Olea europaea subsp. europaea]